MIDTVNKVAGDQTSCWRGRFAPSPTGGLHGGSLTTAVGSYLEARVRGGQWLVRIEDIDSTRVQPGAASVILSRLDTLGFEWDGEVVYQSRRHHLYRAAFETLRRDGYLYPCTCTRKQLERAHARAGVDGLVYPGTCRAGSPLFGKQPAWRFIVEAPCPIGVLDRLQGHYEQCLAREVGDVILRRADGEWAYQLAVVVDDAEQGITDVVRGADLLVSTPRQRWLQYCLGLPAPSYCHLPLLVNRAGKKLSKQTVALSDVKYDAVQELSQALTRLGHPPPKDCTNVTELWLWAYANWSLSRVPQGPIRV